MAKYKIYEHVKTINIYTLDLNDKLVQKLNADIQEAYINERNQPIPYIDLDTLIEILTYRGDLEIINENREKNHETPLEPFEVKKRNLIQMPNQSLYDVILGMIDDYTWSSSHIEEWDSYVDDWYGDLDDEEKN